VVGSLIDFDLNEVLVIVAIDPIQVVKWPIGFVLNEDIVIVAIDPIQVVGSLIDFIRRRIVLFFLLHYNIHS
jgi:hypothetical protein